MLQLVKPNQNLSQSHLLMSVKFLQSAKLLLNNNFYESATSDFYYSIYNSITALLLTHGIKSENHNASIELIKELFEKNELYNIAKDAKEERIDKQYYHETSATKNNLTEIMKSCQKFNLEIKVLLVGLKKEDIEKTRKRFESL